MNGIRGSYSLNSGAVKLKNSTSHFTETKNSINHSKDDVSSSGKRTTSSSAGTRPGALTIVTPSLNGPTPTYKHLNGHTTLENGLSRSKTQLANGGGVSSSKRTPNEKLLVSGNGSADAKAATLVSFTSNERRSDTVHPQAPNGMSSLSMTSSQNHRPNGSGTNLILSGSDRVISPTSSRKLNGGHSSLANGDGNVVRHSLETTDVDSVDDLTDHPFFALTDDCGQQDCSHIVSARGTVRGVRNRVKAGIAVFIEQQGERKMKDYRSLENGKIVVYTTSVMVVRDTYEKCLRVNKILQTHVVRYEVRDISLSRDDYRELTERLGPNVDLPQVFADGIHIGDADEIVRLNENGTLRRIFQRFKTSPSLTSCAKCGGYRYVPCTNCHGSKKSRRNNFTKEFCALRCTVCDDNGLVLCDICTNDETSSSL